MYRLTLFLLITTGFSFAQTTLDSYVKIIEGTSSKEAKIKAYKKIDELTYDKDNSTFIKYTKKHIDFAIDNKDFDEAAQASLKLVYIYFNRTKEPEKAIKAIQKILQHREYIKNTTALGKIYVNYALYYSLRGSFLETIEGYTNAISVFNEKDSIHIAEALFFRGQAFSYKGEFLRTIKDFEKAIEYYSNLGITNYVTYVKAGLAVVYSQNGFYEKTDQIRSGFLQDAINNGDYGLVSITYYNKAAQARIHANTEKEEEFLLKAEEYLNKDPNQNSKEIIYCALAQYYASQHNVTKATDYLLKVQSIIDISKANYRILYHYYDAKALIAIANKKYKDVLFYLKKNEKIFKDWGNITNLIKNQKKLYAIYRKIDSPSIALKYFENYTKLNDSILSIQKSNALLYYENLYEFERKQKNLKLQASNIELLKKTSIIKNYWMIFGGLTLVLIFSFLFLLRNKIYTKRSKSLQEIYFQNLILAQERERKRIANELHDGLGQQLLLIKNQSTIEKSEKIMSFLNSAINEMREIAMNLHPFLLKEYGITQAVEVTLKKFEENSENLFVSYEIDNLEGLFSDVYQLNIFRILQECINNILKHSQATAARFIFEKKSDHIKILINDNGVGYNFSEKIKNKKSLGLKTLRERTKLIKGTMTVYSEKKQGTKIIFNIPF